MEAVLVLCEDFKQSWFLSDGVPFDGVDKDATQDVVISPHLSYGVEPDYR